VIGVVIPALNAASTLGSVVARARRHLPEVLVVDDGSSDETAAVASSAGAAVVRHEVNCGKGAALRTGFARLLQRGASAIVTLDADGQHDPDDIPRFIAAWNDGAAHLVIGSRAAAFEQMTKGRSFGNRFSCGAFAFFTGVQLRDSQSGYRLYDARFLRDLRLRRHAYDAEIEALLVAVRDRRRIETIEIGVPEVDGTTSSHYRPWLDTYRMCRTVVLFSVTQA
jgi:glycosyltransferase involved in cell wall biosynthesis